MADTRVVEGLRLLKAFEQIKDDNVRQVIITFAESYAALSSEKLQSSKTPLGKTPAHLLAMVSLQATHDELEALSEKADKISEKSTRKARSA